MKKIVVITLLLFACMQMKAQVSDISINITPTAGYTWWDNQLFIEDGAMVGGMVGFGFGRFLELRGIYEQSLDLKSTLNNLKVPSDIVDKFSSRTVDVTRWGGEFKANIPTGGWLAPYITLGTGVQKLKLDDLKQEQIYLSGGLGTKFNLGDRVTLNFEGKVHAFNMDPSSILRVTDPTSSDFNNWIDNNISDKRMINLSLNVGLQFYLGGKNQRDYTDLDRAYNKKFSNGFSGLRFVLEPGGAYINFDDNTNLRNTYLLGGAAGFDFNDYVGLRGFYYQSTNDEKISTDFDNLSMYGIDFIGKLNVARGVVPYLTIGGGYLNVYDSYVGKMSLLATNSGYFAKGGLGLSIPISNYFEIFGGANMMFTSDKKDPADLQSTDDLKQHVIYNVGLKFNLGKSANPDRALDSYVQRSVDDRTMMYEQRNAELKKELDQAYEANDSQKAARILSEKQRLETEMVASSDKQRVTPVYNVTDVSSSDGQTLIRLTPAELESLVDKVVKGVGRLERIVMGGNVAPYVQQPASIQPNVASMQPQAASQISPQIYVPETFNNSNQELMNELQRISTRIDDNSRKIDNAFRQQSASDKTYILNPGSNQPSYGVPPMGRDNIIISPDGSRQNMNAQRNSQGRPTSWVLYKGLSPFLGVNFGEATSLLFGIKANYGFSSSDFIFTPDLYFGVGGKVAYGLNANVIYPFYANNYSKFSPYVGLGLGLNKLQDFDFGVNIIGGTYLQVGNGSMFLEYTSRRFFKNNQLSIGYRFDF